jgi:ABC-type Zn uptake system ZnuABC Zn-binding protein ZnuA
MKKLAFLFATAVVAVSFAACGNKAANNEEAQDTTPIVEEAVVEVVVDSTATPVEAVATEEVK